MASPDNNDISGQFAKTWQGWPGLTGWLAEVNNQPLGKRFMVTSFAFFLVGGLMAMLMRIQLTVSEFDFLGPQLYNQLFTMHGTTMMYLFTVPFMEGLALYLLPLMIGSRDVAFPRLTAFSYWMYLFGGLIFFSSFLVGTVPDAGWFAYVPFSGAAHTGLGMDFWLLGLAMVEIAGITAAAEITVTILKFRAPGMALNRMPLFIWAMLAVGLMILLAFTTLLMATLLLELDRAFETRFFHPEFGGNSLLWQHLFWFFGHPEVYIAFIPATGIVSMITPVFARRPIVGYVLIAVAIVVTAFVSYGLWVHHMYTTGLPEYSMMFFAAASLMIALASGTQVFAWIATLWGSRPKLATPLLFVLGFIFLFVLGGITGVMVAIVPFDWQVHDTYFLVAHFHYVLIGGVVFPILAGLHYWLPKMTGRMLSEALGKWSFWLTFVGFNVAFFPMHIMGFFGMPRRVYTYAEELGLDGYNVVATLGSFVLAAGFLVFVVNFFVSLWRGQVVAENPWNADTLEWSLSSPPAAYSFSKPPWVGHLHPLWSPQGQGGTEVERARAAMTEAPDTWRATLTTDAVYAQPQAIQYLPGPTHVPLFAALGLLVASVGVLSQLYLFALAGVVFTCGWLLVWLRPKDRVLKVLHASPMPGRAGLPIFTDGPRSTGWWGTVVLLAVLGTVFAVLFYCYFYIRLFSPVWPQQNLPRPALVLPLLATLLLAASGGTQWWARRALEQAEKRQLQMGLAASFVLGLLFLSWQIYEVAGLPFTPQTNAYASLFYVTHGALGLVLLTGLVILAVTELDVTRRREHRQGILTLQMQITSLFWNFTVVAGLLVLAVLYLSPYVF